MKYALAYLTDFVLLGSRLLLLFVIFGLVELTAMVRTQANYGNVELFGISIVAIAAILAFIPATIIFFNLKKTFIDPDIETRRKRREALKNAEPRFYWNGDRCVFGIPGQGDWT